MTSSLFTHRSIINSSADAVFEWHERPDAILDLIPLRRLVRIESQTGGLRDDGRVKFSIGFGPLRLLWEARHFGYIRGKQFCDEQVRGPFAFWRHTHSVEAIDAQRTLYEDRIEYAVPGGRWMQKLMAPLIARLLAIAFARRHAIVRASVSGA